MQKILLLSISLIAATVSFSQRTATPVLKGKWQSLADKKAFIVLDNGKYTAIYDSKEIDSTTYSIKNNILTVSGAAGKLLYEFSIVQNRLTMIYLPNGNVLLYRRYKPIKRSRP